LSASISRKANGKYQGANGGGTYTQEMVTDTLGGGRFKGEMLLP